MLSLSHKRITTCYFCYCHLYAAYIKACTLNTEKWLTVHKILCSILPQHHYYFILRFAANASPYLNNDMISQVACHQPTDGGTSTAADDQGLYGGGGGMLSRGVSTPLRPPPTTENVSIPSQSSMRWRRCISSIGVCWCSRLHAVAHTATAPE